MLTISIDAWYDDTLKEQNICNCRAPLFSWEESLSTCSSRPSTTSPPQAGTMEMCECSELVWGKSYILEIIVWAGIHADTLWRQLEPQVVLRVCQLLNHRLWRSDPIRWGNCGGSVTYPIEILIMATQECCVHNFENLIPASTNVAGSILKNLLVKIPAAILLATIFLRALPVIS